MKVTINMVGNGYAVEMEEETVVFEENEDTDNKDHVVRMLYNLLDIFGERGTKHDARRIKITYE